MIRLDAETSPGVIAAAYAFVGDTDEAFAWLDRAVQAKDPTAASIYENSPEVVATLRKDPRFVAFSRKVGLPDPATVPATWAKHEGKP